VGACHVLMDACRDGVLLSCVPAPASQNEVCADGIDNNCDGIVDEGCACEVSSIQPCYSGSAPTRSVGLCIDGAQQCATGAWNDCVGDVLPSPEGCDGSDNDCDGEVDEGCACADGQQQTCFGGPDKTRGVGPCKDGAQTCANGVWGHCVGDMLPSIEQHDGFDNDCDGSIDEEFL
jgi:hypothetical protein